MIRCKRRVGSAPDAVAILALISVFVLPVKSGSLTIGGRFGLEAEGTGEEYQSTGLFDDRILPSDGIEEALEEEPVRSRDVGLLGMLELEVEEGTSERAWMRVSNLGRWGSERRRNTLDLELGLRSGSNRFRLEHEWESQGGGDEPASGNQALLTGTIDRESLLGMRAQVKMGADWSRSTGDTLARLFDYRVLRAQAEFRRDLGTGLDLEVRGLGAYRQKESFSSSAGSYDSRSAEIEIDAAPGSSDRLEILLRLEDRTYVDQEAGIPSSSEYEVQARYETWWRSALRPYLEQRVDWQDYVKSSCIFQDNRTWGGEIGSDLLLCRREGDVQDAGEVSSPKWRLRLGSAYEIRVADDDSSDSLSAGAEYREYGAVLGLAREAGGRLWFDVSAEVGRRDYARGGEATLAFEGLNFSLTATDYDYVRASLILQWSPVAWAEQEVFVQWDEELHDERADNFRLWIVNCTIAHRF